ncbi:RHS repeat-associated core domain-containing protein [Streptomyces sp. NPDC006638]|uniref:RHS repeat-associated core domain-containing protein n=1 Tax=Streptomyces sp. NPDC006638 TaxID=3157183 RepID=UPI0033ADEA2E
MHAGTDNSERTKQGSTWFHATALGLTGTTTADTDTGFIREPAARLNSMRTGGKSYYYLTDATGNFQGLADDAGTRTHTYAYGPPASPVPSHPKRSPSPTGSQANTSTPPACTRSGARYYTLTLARFTQPDPPGKENNPYLYAAGDYVNNADPTGLSRLSCLGGTLSTVGGAISLGVAVVSIPALAGKTTRSSRVPLWLPEHPRAGGEDISANSGSSMSTGTPPRWRGRLFLTCSLVGALQTLDLLLRVAGRHLPSLTPPVVRGGKWQRRCRSG